MGQTCGHGTTRYKNELVQRRFVVFFKVERLRIKERDSVSGVVMNFQLVLQGLLQIEHCLERELFYRDREEIEEGQMYTPSMTGITDGRT